LGCGVLGTPGALAMSIQERRKEQDNAITHCLKMAGQHALALQMMKLPA